MAGELHDGAQETLKRVFVNQASKRPTAKVAATGLAGSTAVVIIWGLGQAGIVMPPEVASAFTALVSGAAAYFQKDKL